MARHKANEPLPGSVIGSNFTVGAFGNGAAVFVDRAHSYTNASPTVLIPSYLLGGEYIMSGRGNPDGIHWNFEAHQAVADLTLKALAEAGVQQRDSDG